MATIRRGQPIWIGNTRNTACPRMAGGPEAPHFREAAAQTFKAGDVLYLDASGNIAIATVNGSNQSNSRLAGLAHEAASGVTSDQIYFQAIGPDDLYAMGVFHATPALAITAQDQLGTLRALVKTTVSGNGTNIWCVDIENAVTGASANLARVKIVDFLYKNMFDAGSLDRVAIGDIYGIVVVKFIMSAGDTDGDPSLHNILQLG